MDSDEAVQSTNDDASECKKSAVSLGYWKDPYIPIMVRATDRKAPEINRGYFARTEGVGMFIKQFLKTTDGKGQIVNLGAGFDTLFWRLQDMNYKFEKFVEVDFPNVTAKKCFAIKKNKVLLDGIKSSDGETKLNLHSTELHSEKYHLVAADLRNINEVALKFRESELDFSLPTLFLAECVLVYIETSRVATLLSWIAAEFTTAVFINYEQVNMTDRFGAIMLENLRARGCPLLGADSCTSLDAQKQRFLSANWEGAKAWTMVDIYRSIDSKERERIEHIELLDEQELLYQLMQHYCICVSWRGPIPATIDLPSD